MDVVDVNWRGAVSGLGFGLLGSPYHGLTRTPLTSALLGLIVSLQDPDKISHAGSILVFSHSRNLGIGRGLPSNRIRRWAMFRMAYPLHQPWQ